MRSAISWKLLLSKYIMCTYTHVVVMMAQTLGISSGSSGPRSSLSNRTKLWSNDTSSGSDE